MFWRGRRRATLYVAKRCVVVRAFGDDHKPLEFRHVGGDVKAACELLATTTSHLRGRATARVLVGSSEVVVGAIESLVGVRSTRDWQALVRQRLLVDMGRTSAEWQVSFDFLPGGKRVLAAAIPRARMQEIVDGLEAGKLSAGPIEPALTFLARDLAATSLETDGVVLEEPDGVGSLCRVRGRLSALTVASTTPQEASRDELERLRLARQKDGGAALRLLRFSPADETLLASDSPNDKDWLAFGDRVTVVDA